MAIVGKNVMMTILAITLMIAASLFLYQAWRVSVYKVGWLMLSSVFALFGSYSWITLQGVELGVIYTTLTSLLCIWMVILFTNRQTLISTNFIQKDKVIANLAWRPSLSWLTECSRLLVILLLGCLTSLTMTLSIIPHIPLSEASQLILMAFMFPVVWAVLMTMVFLFSRLWLSLVLLSLLTLVSSTGVWLSL